MDGQRLALAVIVALMLTNFVVEALCCVRGPPWTDRSGPIHALSTLAEGMLTLTLGLLLLVDWRRTDRTLRVNELARRRIDRLAHRDPLTELSNRRAFERDLARRVAHLAEGGGPFALHLIDVDGLKAINDTAGHLVGDHLLQALAASLRTAVRQGDLVARIGGDEFAILQADADAHRAERFALRLLDLLRAAPAVAGTGRLSASLGTAVAPDDTAAADALLAAADRALYAAKEAGGNRWVWVGSLP